LQEEEEGIGDVDLFTLTEDRNKLVVNVKWLQHLQACTCSLGHLGRCAQIGFILHVEAIANANCTLKTLVTSIQAAFVLASRKQSCQSVQLHINVPSNTSPQRISLSA